MVLLVACAACARSLHSPAPLESIAPAPQADADLLVAQADAAWARRGEPGGAAAAPRHPALARAGVATRAGRSGIGAPGGAGGGADRAGLPPEPGRAGRGAEEEWTRGRGAQGLFGGAAARDGALLRRPGRGR